MICFQQLNQERNGADASDVVESFREVNPRSYALFSFSEKMDCREKFGE